ncbi:MAG: hypothetical protein ABI349_09505 [Casimicrobiaceae bacterium]
MPANLATPMLSSHLPREAEIDPIGFWSDTCVFQESPQGRCAHPRARERANTIANFEQENVMSSITRWMGEEPEPLREYLQNASGEEIGLLRVVVAVSLLGIAAMACTPPLQTGLLKKLPELPVQGFLKRRAKSARPLPTRYAGSESTNPRG